MKVPYTFPVKSIKQLLLRPVADQPVVVHGWLQSIRAQKSISFLQLSDSSTSQGIQAVITSASQELKSFTTGASLQIKGRMQALEGKIQKWEVVVDDIKVLGQSDPNVLVATL